MQTFAPGWRQIAICFMLLSATGMIAATYGIIAVPIGGEFQPSRMVLMLAMTVLSGASALIAPFLGNLMDRVSLRLTMALGTLLLVTGYAMLSFAVEFNHVLLIYGLIIAPANVLIGPVATTTLLARWWVRRRGMALGIAIAGVATGSIMFPIIIQSLLDAFHWREALRLLALFLLVFTLPAALLVINRPEDRGLFPDGAAEPPARPVGTAPERRITTGEVLSDPTFWLACFLFAVVTSGMKGMITNLSPMAIDEGVKARDAAYLVTLYGTCGFCAKFAFAALADRIDLRWLMVASLAGFGLGMGLLTNASAGYGAIAIGVACVAMFGGLMVPLEGMMVPRIFGQQAVGKVMGLISSVTLIALLSTPPLFGLIRDLNNSYSAIFAFFAALAVATMLIVPLIRLHPRAAAAGQQT